MSVLSRALCAALKSGDPRLLRRYADRVRIVAANHPGLAEFFPSSAVLVPVPGSAPCTGGAAPNTARLAAEFVRLGLGSRAWGALTRIHVVGKSGAAPPGERPTVAKHYESFGLECGVRDSGCAAADLILIDDVVTKGRTLLAAASRLRDAYPNARIRAFALLRTMGLKAEVTRLLEPCVGEIRWKGGDALRVP